MRAFSFWGRLELQIEGYLPTSKVAFLDEIWKSGPAILNTLLTIVNEKKFHNGKDVVAVPLISLCSASNELPAKGLGLEALWDRFILRVIVNPVEDEIDFLKVINDNDSVKWDIPKNLLTTEEVLKWQDEIKKVKLTNEIENVILSIKKELVKRNNELIEKNNE